MSAPLRIDAQLVGELGREDEAARRLKEVGFDGAFTFEGAHDVFFPLLTAARAGTGLDLMTNVAIALPRSPIHLAHAAWDLQTISGGRFRLGLGSQVRTQIQRRYGSRWQSPVDQLREWVNALRAIFGSWQNGERLDFRGTYTTHTLMTPTFNPGPNPFGAPPILLGALGPRMTRLAAQVADGVLVMPFNTEGHVRDRALPAIDAGLAAAGRPTRGSSDDRFEIVIEVIVCCGRNDAELATAEAGVKALLGFYGSTPAYRSVLEGEGYDALQPDLNAASKRGEWARMADMIDEGLLHRLAVHGTPAECARQIHDRYGTIATRLAVYQPYAAAPETTAELLAALRAGQET